MTLLTSPSLVLPSSFSKYLLPCILFPGCALIAVWNYYCCDLLLQCREFVDSVASGAEDVEPNALYPFIGRKAVGPWGKSGSSLDREGCKSLSRN